MTTRAANPSLLKRLARHIKDRIPHLSPPSQPGVDPALLKQIRDLAKLRTTPLSLLDLYRYGLNSSPQQRLKNAQFLHWELPRRIAQRVVELQQLPPPLLEQRGIQNVISWYSSYVGELVTFPKPMNQEEEYDFTCLLASILCDHTSVPRALASGIQNYREGMSYEDLLADPERLNIENILSNFYTARIGLRFLVEHHIVSQNNLPGYSGIIASECSPVQVARIAVQEVEKLARATLGAVPPMQVFGKESDVFTYVPSHLYYMISETLKNACRAVVEHNHPAYRRVQGKAATDLKVRQEAKVAAEKDTVATDLLPPVKVVVAMGDEDVTIKVADEGGGVPRSDLKLLWTFFYTTYPTQGHPARHHPLFSSSLDEEPYREDGGSSSTSVATNASTNPNIQHLVFPNVGTESTLAGHGMGLPLSRIYAKYFGGDLEVKSLEGYGMDSYLHLCKLGDKCEDLGLQVMCSPSMRDSSWAY